MEKNRQFFELFVKDEFHRAHSTCWKPFQMKEHS